MPEPPDFDQIADTLVHEAAMVIGATRAGTDCVAARRIMIEQLRLVWNARGAADIAKIRSELSKPLIEQDCDRALRNTRSLNQIRQSQTVSQFDVCSLVLRRPESIAWI